MSDSWSDDQGGPEEARPPLVLPLIATGIAAGLLLLLAFVMPRGLDTGHNDSSVIGGLVSGCIVGVILWGIAFAVTIRRAAGGWQVATLLFTIAVGVVSQVAAITLAAQRISGDMATVAQQFRAVSADGQMPERVPEGTGPVSRMGAVFMNGMLQDRRAFDHDAETLGLARILNPEGLTHSSPVLQHCGDFEALAARARRLGTSGWDGHFAEARRIGDEAVRNREITAGDADAFFASVEENHYSYQRQWTLNAETIEDAQQLCELLARRPWTLRGSLILFSSQADLSEARFHIDRVQRNANEQRVAAEEERRRMFESAGRLGN